MAAPVQRTAIAERGARPLWFLLAVLGLLAVATPAWAAESALRLEVWDTRAETLLLSLPVQAGATFYFRYTHSTAKTAVEEHFEVRGPGAIVLTRMVYASAGAGIPDGPPPGARFRIAEDGRFVLEHLGRRFAALERIRVAYFYPFVLGTGGREYDLAERARGRLVDVRVR